MTFKTATLFGALMIGTAATAGEITIYTSYEEDEAAAFLDLARAALPDVEMNMLRLSQGDLAARIIAEKGNPQHDVLWGFAASAIVDPQIEETLEPYAPDGVKAIPAQFRSPDDKWFAVTGYMAAFCVNSCICSSAVRVRPDPTTVSPDRLSITVISSGVSFSRACLASSQAVTFSTSTDFGAATTGMPARASAVSAVLASFSTAWRKTWLPCIRR